jgi:hypothetical protein
MFLAVIALLAQLYPPVPQHAPVVIDNCRVVMVYPRGLLRHAGPGPLVGGVAIKFVDNADVVANEVTFIVEVNDHTETIVARGKFSPGVPIDARFGNFAGEDFWRPEPDACAVVGAKFANGAGWGTGAPTQ